MTRDPLTLRGRIVVTIAKLLVLLALVVVARGALRPGQSFADPVVRWLAWASRQP